MFSRAFKGKGLRVIYADRKKRLVKVGGTRSWRNNNPGNIKSGVHSRIHGSIGSIGGFALFPTYEEGREALVRLLKRSDYREKTIYDMVKSYAPKEDLNNPTQYRKLIRKKTGLKIDRNIKGLSKEELDKLVQAIQEIEGFRIGTEETLYAKSIIDIQTDKRNTIVAYQIEGMGWMSKPEVIQLIDEGRVDAVIVEESGSIYIRTRPDGEIFNNLQEKKPKKGKK